MMKNKINLYHSLAFLMFLLFCCFSCESQSTPKKGKTPQAVKDTFQKMYPGENDPDWHTDKNDNYEAHFKIDGIRYNADFSPNGQWIETETKIKKKELPDVIMEILEKEYEDYKIVEIEKVEHHSKGLFYDVELKDKGEKMDIEFKADGTKIN